MATLAKLFVELGLDPKGFEKGLDNAIGRAKKAGGQLRKVGLGMSAAFTAPAIATGAALLKVGQDFDSLQDTIRVGTGATGEELKGLTDTALSVFKSIPTSMDAVGIALTTLQQITGATGITLEDLTRTQLELARVTGTDLKGNIEATSKAFEQWGVNVNDQSMVLDQLFRATQATGVPVATLAQQLSQYGPILRQMGFGIDDSIALLGTLGKAGLDVGQVITGMRTAFKKFADEGLTDTNKALQDVFTRIKNAPSDLEAGTIAIDTFGSRAGPALADSIRGGRIEYEDLLDVVLNGKDTILDAAADSNDLSENWQIFKNRIAVAVLPIATRLFNFLNDKGIPVLEKLAGWLEKAIEWFGKLPAPIKIGIAIFMGLLAAIGPVLIVLGTLIPIITTVIAAFSAGGIFAAGGALAFFGPLLIIIGLVVAAVVLLALAWKNNWFDIQGKTATAVDFLVGLFHTIVDFIQPVIDIVVELGHYFYDVATNQIQPGNLAKLPGWLQPIAYVIGRIIKTVRIFIKVWQDKGLVAALKTLPKQIRAFGRAVSQFLDSIGLKRAADVIKKIFYDLSSLFGHVVDLIDDLVHGRWKEVWTDLKAIALDLLHLFLDNLEFLGALLLDIFEAIPWGTIGSALWTGLQVAVGFLLTTGLPWLLEQGKALLGKLWEGMQWAWDELILPGLKALPGLMVDLLAVGWDLLYNAGNFLIDALGKGISFAWDWLWGWFKDLGNRLLQPFAGIWNAFFNIGWSIIAGMSAGIQSIWNTLVGWIDSIMDQFNRIPDFLKKGSPSKWAMEVAHSVPWGLAEGIKKGMPLLTKSVDSMTGTFAAMGTSTVSTPRLSAMPAVAGAGGGGSANRSVTFAQGAIVVNGAGHDPELIAEMTAKKIVRKIQSVQAGAV